MPYIKEADRTFIPYPGLFTIKLLAQMVGGKVMEEMENLESQPAVPLTTPPTPPEPKYVEVSAVAGSIVNTCLQKHVTDNTYMCNSGRVEVVSNLKIHFMFQAQVITFCLVQQFHVDSFTRSILAKHSSVEMVTNYRSDGRWFESITRCLLHK